jgi:type II secretory pathway component PulM
MNKHPNQQSNIVLERLSAFGQKIKALLTKDYSMQDLRNLPNLIKDWWNSTAKEIRQAQSVATSENVLAHKSLGTFDPKQILQMLQRFVLNQRKALLLVLLLLVLWITYVLVLAPYSLRLQEQLEMRPAQWSQLQSLIRISKTSAAGPGLSTSSAMSSTVSSLDDQELEKILSGLKSRGVKPSAFRLTSDNPPRLEFQASEVMFSVLLDILEEFRITWRLYPNQLSVVANSGAGMVYVSGVLTQYGSNATSAGVSQ